MQEKSLSLKYDKLLKTHEEMKLVCNQPHEYFDQQPNLRQAISRVDISAASNVAPILIVLMIFHIAIMHLHAPLLNVNNSFYKVKPGRII